MIREIKRWVEIQTAQASCLISSDMKLLVPMTISMAQFMRSLSAASKLTVSLVMAELLQTM